MQPHSPAVRLAYLAAAVPAGFLPVSYLVFAVGILGHSTSPHVSEDPSDIVMGFAVAGLAATTVQWPIYLVWAAFSRELTLKLRLLWVVVLVVFNMFAIPWFLYCKYRGTTDMLGEWCAGSAVFGGLFRK